MPDLEFAHAVLVLDCDPVDDAPILDLRIRKGVRRHGVRLAVASARPGALDPNAETVLRYAPGAGEALLVGARRRARRRRRQPRRRGDRGRLERRGRARRSPSWLAGAGEDVVILYGERLLTGPRGARGRAGAAQPRRAARPRRPRRRRAARDPGARRTAAASARSASPPRTAPATPTAGAPTARVADGDAGRALPAARRPAAHASATAPAGRPRSAGAQTVIAHASTLTGRAARARRRRLPRRGLRREGGHDRRTPTAASSACGPRSGAPAGSTPACAPAGRSSPRSRSAPGPTSACSPGPMASQQLFDAVPFYAGLTLDAIGGRGVRWPATEAAAALGADAVGARARSSVPPLDRRGRRTARCGSAPGARSGRRPRSTSRRSLQFLRPRQVVELSPVDADRLGVRDGDEVEVGSNGTRVRGAARLRAVDPGRLGLPRRGHARRSPRTCSPSRSSRCAASAAPPSSRAADAAIADARRRGPRRGAASARSTSRRREGDAA